MILPAGYNIDFFFPFIEVGTLALIIDNYIEIAERKYFIGGNNDLQSFKFEINKRGGDSANVTFASNMVSYNAGDKVVLYIKGEQVYTGLIEKLGNGGKELDIIPLWGRLLNEYVIGSLNLSAEVSVYDLVISLMPFITNQGIGFVKDKTYIDIPKDVLIETSLSGRCISDILDDIEKTLPDTYSWGVDNKGIFFFRLTDDKAKRTIGFDLGSFSESTIETDYAYIFSEMLVKVKQKAENIEGMRSIGIVGRGAFKYNGFDFFYPRLALSEFVGKKQNTKEFNIDVDISDRDALKNIFDMAYNEINYQTIPVASKIKNINIDKYAPSILETVKIRNTPIIGLSLDVLGGQSIIEKHPALNFFGGQLCPIGATIQYSSAPMSDDTNINLRYNYVYQDFCNRVYNITNIVIKYEADLNTVEFQVTDGSKYISTKGTGGTVNVVLPKMNKRNIAISCLSNTQSMFYKRIVVFSDFGSVEETLTTRKISFDYKNGMLSSNAEYSKVNTVLTGLTFSQNQKIQNLEKLISSAEEKK